MIAEASAPAARTRVLCAKACMIRMLICVYAMDAGSVWSWCAKKSPPRFPFCGVCEWMVSRDRNVLNSQEAACSCVGVFGRNSLVIKLHGRGRSERAPTFCLIALLEVSRDVLACLRKKEERRWGEDRRKADRAKVYARATLKACHCNDVAIQMSLKTTCVDCQPIWHTSYRKEIEIAVRECMHACCK